MSIEKENIIEEYKKDYHAVHGIKIDDIIKNKTPVRVYCNKVSKNYLKTYFNVVSKKGFIISDISSYYFIKNITGYTESGEIPYFIFNNLIPREELTIESFIELFTLCKQVYENAAKDLKSRSFMFTKLNLYSAINSSKGLQLMYYAFLKTLSHKTNYGQTDVLNANFLFNIRAEIEYLQAVNKDFSMYNTKDFLEPYSGLSSDHMNDIVIYNLKPILKEFYEAGVLFDSTKNLYELLKYAEE